MFKEGAVVEDEEEDEDEEQDKRRLELLGWSWGLVEVTKRIISEDFWCHDRITCR